MAVFKKICKNGNLKKNHIKNSTFEIFLSQKFHTNIHQNAPNCTIIYKYIFF